MSCGAEFDKHRPLEVVEDCGDQMLCQPHQCVVLTENIMWSRQIERAMRSSVDDVKSLRSAVCFHWWLFALSLYVVVRQ